MPSLCPCRPLPDRGLKIFVDPALKAAIANADLGQSSVCSFVRRPNGHIRVESRGGEGTTFTLRFTVLDSEPVTMRA